MNKDEVKKKLLELQDEEYQVFQNRLVPGQPEGRILGVRVPALRKIARELVQSQESQSFLDSLPHEYFEEDMIHALILSMDKDYEHWKENLLLFLPWIDNWAVCDVSSPVFPKENREDLERLASGLILSDHPWTIRSGISIFLRHFLKEGFRFEQMEKISGIHREEKTVNQMIGWYLAEAMITHWPEVRQVLEGNTLTPMARRMALSKGRESFRISEEKKEELKRLQKTNREYKQNFLSDEPLSH